MWVLLKINFDNSWSVIAKCTKGPLMSTHSASENVFTKQFIELLLILSGDVEQNPGPEKEKSHITLCHWNLNGLMAHNFIKVSLLHTLTVTNDYDIICLTETFLDSSTDNDDDRISIPGYILLRTGHPSNTKRGGVCIYYKDHLPIIKRNDLCQLHECMVTEMRIGKNKCFFTCLYRSPSQTSDEFEDFCTDLNLFLSNINDLNPTCSVITGDFNARSPEWWALDRENNEGHEISFLTSSAGYSQLIDQPTHTTKESSSCIDLTFTSNPSFISASGVELSLYEKCNHNLIYGKINFNVPLPPPYIREVWDYKNAKVENIQQSVSGIDWDFMFQGKTVNQKVNILNECLSNVFHNFIPNKKIKFIYKDPAWITETVKSKLRERSNLVKRYYKNGKKNTDLEKALTKSNECTEIILAAKEKYINELSKKLSNPETAPKTYWKILNRFLSNKKIPSIPPLLVNGEMMSNFPKKSRTF